MKINYKTKFFLTMFSLFSLFVAMMIINGCKEKGQSQVAQDTNDSQTATEVTTSESSGPAETIAISEKIKLKILYAGLLGTERAKDFTDFFNRYFEQVDSIDLYKFTESLAADFDVAVIDHNGVGFNVKLPAIPPDYSRATVTMGVPGAFICSRLSLKTSYL